MSQAFALSVPHESALKAKEDIAFFQALKARLMKFEGEGGGKSNAQMESAIKQTNVVRSRALLEMLEGAIKKYQNNLLTTTEIIQFLVVIVKRTLTKYGYPSDQQTKAIETVLRQAERSADYWTA